MDADVVFDAAVRAQQAARGSRDGYARMEAKGWRREVDGRLVDFLAERDSFYLATASADGRPYIQHRGGPKGFLRPLGPTTLGFADFGGNRQYITLGHLTENDRASIFLMDYPGRRRIKLWGRARFVEGDPALLARLADPAYGEGAPERAILFEVEAWDVNCPQHIRPRFTAEEVRAGAAPLLARLEALEAENAALRARLAAAGAAPAAAAAQAVGPSPTPGAVA